jgi:hypothetical protein
MTSSKHHPDSVSDTVSICRWTNHGSGQKGYAGRSPALAPGALSSEVSSSVERTKCLGESLASQPWLSVGLGFLELCFWFSNFLLWNFQMCTKLKGPLNTCISTHFVIVVLLMCRFIFVWDLVKVNKWARYQWLTPVILATWEVAIRRILTWGQPGQIVHETRPPHLQNNQSKKNGLR